MNIELIPEKKRIGRPPLSEDVKKVRFHISVNPKLAALAKDWQWGVSDYFETLHKEYRYELNKGLTKT